MDENEVEPDGSADDENELGAFWPYAKPKFSDTRNYQVFNAAKTAATKVKHARQAAERNAKRGDPAAAWAEFEVKRAEATAGFEAARDKIDAKRGQVAPPIAAGFGQDQFGQEQRAAAETAQYPLTGPQPPYQAPAYQEPPYGQPEDPYAGWTAPQGEPVRRRGTDPQGPQPGYGPPPGYAPAPPAPKKKRSKLGIGCLGAVVLVVAIIIGASLGSKNTPAGSGATTPPIASSPVNTAAASAAPVVPTVPATTQAPPPAQTVTYSCTGHAPDGVDITYGAEGSDAEASHLPFTHTDPLDTSAGYFAVQAQLSGDGSVSCSTVVDWTDGSGDAQSATQSGTASGGYNIASAEICGDFEGGWDAC